MYKKLTVAALCFATSMSMQPNADLIMALELASLLPAKPKKTHEERMMEAEDLRQKNEDKKTQKAVDQWKKFAKDKKTEREDAAKQEAQMIDFVKNNITFDNNDNIVFPNKMSDKDELLEILNNFTPDKTIHFDRNHRWEISDIKTALEQEIDQEAPPLGDFYDIPAREQDTQRKQKSQISRHKAAIEHLKKELKLNKNGNITFPKNIDNIKSQLLSLPQNEEIELMFSHDPEAGASYTVKDISKQLDVYENL